jgi:hypothetical protein
MLCPFCAQPVHKSHPHADPAACVNDLRARLRQLRIENEGLACRVREAERCSEQGWKERHWAVDYNHEATTALEKALGPELLGRMPVARDAEPYEGICVGILYLRARVAELEAAVRAAERDVRGRCRD